MWAADRAVYFAADVGARLGWDDRVKSLSYGVCVSNSSTLDAISLIEAEAAGVRREVYAWSL